MGSFATSKIGDLVVPNGTSVSNVLPATIGYEDAVNIMLHAITVADGAITYTLEVCGDADPLAAGAVFRTLQILNGAVLADLAIPNTDTKSMILPYGTSAATGIRIKASGNVTANRTFRLSKQYQLV